MAITSSAGDGVRVTTAAKNGTLGSQAGAASDEIIFDTAITTNNGNLMASPTFVGRLVLLRRGTGTEELRYITAIVSGNQVRVNEAWTVVPASSDTYHISYIIQDAATLTGLSLVTKRVADYSSSRRFGVGNAAGGGFAFFAMVDGVSLESVDNSSTTVADFTVTSDGMFVNGYLSGGTPVSGGYIIGTPAVNGELVFEAVSGSRCYLYDWFLTCVRQNFAKFNGTVVFNKSKTFSAAYGMQLNGIIDATDLTIEGKGQTTDTVWVDDSSTINSLTIISTNGFVGDADTSTQTITLNNVTFVRTLRYFLIWSGKTFNLIDPVAFSLPTSGLQSISTLQFAGTGFTGVLNQQYSLATTVQTAAGAGIASPRLFLYEGLRTDSLVLDLTGDGSGVISSSWVYRSYKDQDNDGTSFSSTTDGSHAIRAYKYTYSPFVATQTSTVKFSSPITLISDTAITQPTQATAITNGSGIVVARHGTGETDPRPLTVMNYDGGTIAFVAGNTVTGATSGATGVVVEVIGTTSSGVLVLETRNAIEYSDNENLQVAAVTNALSDVAGFYEKYTWEVDCNTYALTTVYDYLAAKMAEGTIDATFTKVHRWGQNQQGQLMYSGTSGYYTPRNTTLAAGVWLSNRGAGTVAYMTADDGSTYVPPVQYTFSLTGLQSNTEVRIYKTSDNTLVAGTESSGASFSYNYTYVSDIGVYIVIFHLSYKDIRLTGLTLSNSSQSIPIQQQIDRVYSNP